MFKIKNDVNVVKRTSAANIDNAKKKLRQAMIAEAAYYLAKKRGFIAGHEMDDWFEAEKKL
ncbi:MAG: DUF2934 domain-containing protein [Methylococcales bacterium]|nr:DUF2934 domain-containing protein [Methylococcales bacterium]